MKYILLILTFVSLLSASDTYKKIESGDVIKLSFVHPDHKTKKIINQHVTFLQLDSLSDSVVVTIKNEMVIIPMKSIAPKDKGLFYEEEFKNIRQGNKDLIKKMNEIIISHIDDSNKQTSRRESKYIMSYGKEHIDEIKISGYKYEHAYYYKKYASLMFHDSWIIQDLYSRGYDDSYVHNHKVKRSGYFSKLDEYAKKAGVQPLNLYDSQVREESNKKKLAKIAIVKERQQKLEKVKAEKEKEKQAELASLEAQKKWDADAPKRKAEADRLAKEEKARVDAVNEKKSEDRWEWIFIGSFVFIIVCMLFIKSNTCSNCKSKFTLVTVFDNVIGSYETTETITHRDETFDKDHNISGYQNRTESVPVTVNKYHRQIKCSHCDHTTNEYYEI
jgi:hypothetical protein